jgi:hypothetical protein
LRRIALGIPLLVGGAAAAALLSARNERSAAERAAAEVLSRSVADGRTFDMSMLEGQPEIARRYFAHAIAPGTPLRLAAELEMNGTFLLGSKSKFQTYEMNAHQVLRPPFEFVWMPQLSSGPMRIGGSDALVEGAAWTRFWLLNLVKVANEQTSPDLVRSASFRAAVEGIWVPTSLLPQAHVRWEQVGPDTARVTVGAADPPVVLNLTLDAAGAVKEVVGQRWSNANPDKVFRLQPFGGTIHGEATFDGYTIPSVLHVGNHYGTKDYLPFFQARITAARYR